MKKMFLGLIALALTSTMSAQSYMGLEMDLALPTMYDDGDASDAFDSFKEFSATFVTGKQLFESFNVYLEGGLGIDFYADKEKKGSVFGEYKGKLSMFAFNVPVKLVYNISVNNIAIKPFIGLGEKYYQSANIKLSGKNFDEKYNMFDEDEAKLMYKGTWNRFQTYFMAGVMASYMNYNIGITYKRDLTDFAEDCKFRGTAISLAYIF